MTGEVVVNDGDIKIERLQLGPFGTNSYILVCLKTGDSVIVDAPGETGIVLESLKGTNPGYILMTHNHMDHTGGLKDLKTALDVPVAAHEADSAGLPVKPDRILSGGDTIPLGDIKLQVLHTPGHTPGGLCFRAGKYLISGDTIFSGGPGKTWAPENLKQIIESILDNIFVLPEDTEIYPGHGPSTVLATEKEQFEIFASRSHSPDLCGDIVWLTS